MSQNEPVSHEDIMKLFGFHEVLTRREICERLGRKKAPHMILMIEELVETGQLYRATSQTRQGAPIFFYTRYIQGE